MSGRITYEHPLNERTRLLLRLAHLLDQFSVFHQRGDEWDSRCAVQVLVDISLLLSRTDIKAEIIKELERQVTKLSLIRSTPGVDAQRLGSVMDALEKSLHSLHISSGPLGHELRENEFIKAVMQRSAIPGGSCNFDLPQYNFWLKLPASERVDQLSRWFYPLLPLKQSVSLLVEMIRTSNNPATKMAEQGFYQQSLDAKTPVQLIRVSVPFDMKLIAEISGGKHRFSVRFLRLDEHVENRPVQATDNFEFELTTCII